ncbi:MAG TPA: hypothetical protein PL023_12810 [Thiobacillus sp.]|nr:hypothetical protein [Thiobacillus sp.]
MQTPITPCVLLSLLLALNVSPISFGWVGSLQAGQRRMIGSSHKENPPQGRVLKVHCVTALC